MVSLWIFLTGDGTNLFGFESKIPPLVLGTGEKNMICKKRKLINWGGGAGAGGGRGRGRG